AVDLAQIDVVRQHNPDSSGAEAGAFTAQSAYRFKKAVALRDFKLQEFEVGLALFFQIAESGDPAVFQDQHLVTALFNVAQQVGRDQHGDFAGIANFAH